MKNLTAAVWIFVIATAESLLAPYIKIGNIIPDLLFIFALCYSLTQKNTNKVLFVSVLAGAVADCLYSRIFGVNVLIFVACNILAYVILDGIFKENTIFSIIILIFVNLLYGIIFYLVNISILKSTPFSYQFINIIIPQCIYNTVGGMIILPIMNKCMKKKVGVFR